MSAISVESGEFEVVDDKRPEETSEVDRELEEEEVDEMGRILEEVDEVSKSIVDENVID